MGHGRLDSILDSYSIPGIGFFPSNPSKNIGSGVRTHRLGPINRRCKQCNRTFDKVDSQTVQGPKSRDTLFFKVTLLRWYTQLRIMQHLVFTYTVGVIKIATFADILA
jgi:hypothetical protein